MTEKDIISAATGRRKTAVARVQLLKGTGVCKVNRRDASEYFKSEALLKYINQPLDITGLAGQFDIHVYTNGGGISGQAGAVRHALARALCLSDASLRKALKVAGCLTRDPRMKERKKPGLRGARRRFQFSKR